MSGDEIILAANQVVVNKFAVWRAGVHGDLSQRIRKEIFVRTKWPLRFEGR